MSIQFFSEDLVFTLPGIRNLRRWIIAAAEEENYSVDELNFIFCTDEYLLDINKKFLNHDYFTDIITFDNSADIVRSESNSPNRLISGDLFISIPRVKENAKNLNLKFRNELQRVIIHGALHLMGYTDKGKKEKEIMTRKENYYLLRVK